MPLEFVMLVTGIQEPKFKAPTAAKPRGEPPWSSPQDLVIAVFADERVNATVDRVFVTLGPYDLVVSFACESQDQAAAVAMAIHTLFSAQTVTMSVVASDGAASAALEAGVLAASDLQASGHDEVAKRVLAAAKKRDAPVTDDDGALDDLQASGHDDAPSASGGSTSAA